MVIALDFAETLGGSCHSNILSFMSAKHTIEICNTLKLKTTFSIISVLVTFSQEDPQMLCAKFSANW